MKQMFSDAKRFALTAVGCLSAFLVSMAAIRFLMDFVRQHSFSAFGWYRIGAAIVMLVLILNGLQV